MSLLPIKQGFREEIVAILDAWVAFVITDQQALDKLEDKLDDIVKDMRIWDPGVVSRR